MRANFARDGGLKWTRYYQRIGLCEVTLIAPCSLRRNGGLKWTRYYQRIGLCEVTLIAPCSLRRNGGLKWTRTTDLTLIRRVL